MRLSHFSLTVAPRQGRTAAEPGLCFGHENQGIVDEVRATTVSMRCSTLTPPAQVGSGVTLLKKGDRVNLPFNIGCGGCRVSALACSHLLAR